MSRPRKAAPPPEKALPVPDEDPGAEPGEIEAGLLLDLEAFPQSFRDGAIARTALMLARQLDARADIMAPRDVASYVQRIGVAVAQLREMSPGEAKGDATDDARERRETRLRLAE